ncbi:hypothetical protein CVT26_015855 [Gymnopilus dilepis]|uniref:Uncharacterized protein n=1 Tax=Gymnopilus dilepis TaxID=231916 RepID=A0A409XYB2_9AGAR|nr:hypothetical protein CVT26_015855 [Gymnopilus dilepis]
MDQAGGPLDYISFRAEPAFVYTTGLFELSEEPAIFAKQDGPECVIQQNPRFVLPGYLAEY